MNVVILGGNGYLGEKLGKYLAGQGMSIYSVVRKPIVQKWASEIWIIDEISERLKKKKVDWIINCIAQYERNGVPVEEVLDANYVRPFACFAAAMDLGVTNYMTMDTGLSVDCNLYSRAKKQFADSVEWRLDEIFGKNNYIFWNVLLENFYGEDESSERFIPGTIDKLLRNEKILLTQGYQKRDFIYINDVIYNLEKLLFANGIGRIDLPLGSGEGISIRNMIAYLKEITKSTSELCFGAIPARTVEPDSIADCKMMKKYGLSVKYDWRTGLQYITKLRADEQEVLL